MMRLLVFYFPPTSPPLDPDKETKYASVVFEPRRDGYGSEYQDSGLSQIFKLIVSISKKIFKNRNTVVRRQLK